MDFDIKKLGDAALKVVASVAPAIATALGGPLAGVGVQALSTALIGKPDATENEIAAALTSGSPDMLLKLKEADNAFRVKMEELDVERERIYAASEAGQSKDVNETMRAEVSNASQEAWYQKAWRPFIGFITGIAFLVVTIFTCILGYRAVVERDATALAMIPQFVTAMGLLFTLPFAVLGVSAHHRGMMQRLKQ